MKDDEISNETWDFYMKAAPMPETNTRFYTQQFPVRNLNAVHEKVLTLFDAIKHGDDKHQEWLKEKIKEHFK